MHINAEFGEIEVVNEPTYTFGSADNGRSYPFVKALVSAPSGFSTHGVLLNGEPLAVFGDGGCSSVHQHSALYLNGHVFLAVGNKVACFRAKPFEFEWQLQVDPATCFGIHYQPEQAALISHGELEIARISKDGHVLWSTSGADIFSEGFRLLPHCIEATDFNHRVYRFSYGAGAEGV